jgi:GMP synthase (glutamine-hydrolysing)
VQFHPEVDADVLRGYVKARAPAIRAEGLDADAILAGVTEAPHAQALLRNFVVKFVR